MKPAPNAVEAPPGTRRLLPEMRVLLVVFSLLTAAAVGSLFVLSETTAQTFAWTI